MCFRPLGFQSHQMRPEDYGEKTLTDKYPNDPDYQPSKYVNDPSSGMNNVSIN